MPGDSNDSLIEREARQPELLASDEGVVPGAVFSDLEGKGEFTGDRLFRERPEIYRFAVSLLAGGVGVIKIGKLLKVSPNTVLAVRRREGVSIDIEKKRLSQLAHEGAGLAGEGIVEGLGLLLSERKLETLGAKELAALLQSLSMTFGILTDKGQLLAGEATSRVEVKDLPKPGHDDFNAYIAGLRSASGTGLGGGKGGAKGIDQGADQAATGAPGAVIEVPGEAKADLQSEVKAVETVGGEQP